MVTWKPESLEAIEEENLSKVRSNQRGCREVVPYEYFVGIIPVPCILFAIT